MPPKKTWGKLAAWGADTNGRVFSNIPQKTKRRARQKNPTLHLHLLSQFDENLKTKKILMMYATIITLDS
jgi:hypothetical protein